MAFPAEANRSLGVYLAVPAIIGVGFILNITQSFMIPFVVAALLAVLFAPIQVYLHKKGLPEFVGSILIFVIIFSLMTVLGLVLYGSIRAILDNSSNYSERFNTMTANFMAFLKQRFEYDIEEEIWHSDGQKLLSFIEPSSIFTSMANSMGNFINFFSNLLTMLLFLMFMLLSRKQINQTIFKFLEAQRIDDHKSQQMVKSIGKQIQDYLWLKTVISVGTGVATWAACLLLGLDFAIVWGLLAFLLNFIPSVGPLIAGIPPIILAFFEFSDQLGWAVLVSLILIAIQFISGNIVEPKLMGDRLNLNILVVLLCLFVWGMIWGFAGMVLSVPLTASINIILNNSSRYKNISILLSN